MSLDDFCRMSPDEFGAVCDAFNRRSESEERAKWERMRLHAAITIQPHVTKKISPEELLRFPWDEKKEPRKGRRATRRTMAERRALMMEKFAQFGEKI